MAVFAFDRDWTVDVNPHPNRDAVPLEWVRHLAHETEHAVYAIGNQDLAAEAAIPGVVDIVGRHPDDWGQWLGEKRPNGRYERFPLRRERLSLIEDLHPEADRFVVVDDLDLSDVEGWDHFHAWEFVPAVKDGRIDASLPWAEGTAGSDDLHDDDQLVPDGGRPRAAGIVPRDASHLASFLDDYGPPGFEITYTENGDERTRLCWDVIVISDSDDGLADPSVRCSQLPPDDEEFTVPVDAISMLNVQQLSTRDITERTVTSTQTAAALRRFAELQPHAVRVSSVLTLLDTAEQTPEQKRDALRTLALVAAAKPAECTPAIPILRSLLDDDDLDARHDVLATLRAIGEDSPADIAPLTDHILSALDSKQSQQRREAAGCVAAIAREYPEDVTAAVPDLVTLLDEAAAWPRSAVYALGRIASADPGTIEPAAHLLADVATDESAPATVRMSATAALGRAIRDSSSLALDLFEDVTALYAAEDTKLRNNAVALTYEVAELHSDVVEPYVDDIAALLTVEDTPTRINASGTLARVAEDFPDSLDHLTPRLVESLTDDDKTVRENICWTLGRMQATEARSALEDRLHEEPDATVRNRIAWALSEIDPI
ncbi:MAG: HEAT repeat domain-containing protein [Halapricum sp.]